MTVEELLDSKSTVKGTTAIEHLRNIRQNNISVCEEIIPDVEVIALEEKYDIISLNNQKATELVTKRETQASMEKLNGIRENS